MRDRFNLQLVWAEMRTADESCHSVQGEYFPETHYR
jgi:hypothetical protein